MAIRERKGRKKPWEVYWNNPFTLKRESLYVETEEEAKKQDALKKYQLKYERDSFRNDDQKDVKKLHTLETAYYEYLKEKKFSKESLKWQIGSMKIPLELIGSKPTNDITGSDLINVKRAMEIPSVLPITVRNRMSVLRTVLRWCYKNDLITKLPKFPELPQALYRPIIPPTDTELALMWQCSPPHIQRVIVVGAFLGVRVGPSELFKLRWEHVDFCRRIVLVPAAKKNLREPWREVPIRDSIVPLMQQWIHEDKKDGIEYLISYNGKPVSSIKNAWMTAQKRAKIRKFTPYSLRHKFATDLLAAGVDPGTVAKLMGHTSTDMVFAHYQWVVTAQKRKAVECLPEMSFCSEYVAGNMWQKENGLRQ